MGAPLIDIIGQTVIGSREKQAQVFAGLPNTSGLTPCCLSLLLVENMFFSRAHVSVSLLIKVCAGDSLLLKRELCVI